MLTLRGDNYFLLPGLQFNNSNCRPNITSIAISGEGNFSIALLQMDKSAVYRNMFLEVKRQPLHAAQPGHPYETTRVFELDFQYNISIIALAVQCKSTRLGCVFNGTIQNSAQHSATFWTNLGKDTYIRFLPNQNSSHPVFSLSLSCK